MTRALVSFQGALIRIEEKLDRRPDWEDINRIAAAQAATDKKQDEAIKSLEDHYSKLVLGLAGTFLSALVSIAVGVLSR